MNRGHRPGRLISVFVYILLSCLLCIPAQSIAQDFTAKTIGRYGNVAVMEVSGNYNANNPGTAFVPRQVIAKEFYNTYKDEYDFIVIFTNFNFQMPKPETLAFYTGVKNDTKGIGLEIFDNTALYGSNGKLQGTVDMGNTAVLVSDPLDKKFNNSLNTLSHELMHRWSAFVKFKDIDGNPSPALLDADGKHWSYLLDTNASLMYGNHWKDNGDGTFTSMGIRKDYSPLDMYLMGFYDKNQVPPMLLIENAEIDPSKMPELNTTISGTARYVTIDDIIAAEGERIPSVADSQKEFKIGFVLATRPGTFTGSELPGIETLRNEWVKRYSILTDGAGIIEVFLAAREDVPQNGGITDPVIVPRDLPPNIDDGVKWLMSKQAVDGSWNDRTQTAARDTSETLMVLKKFEMAARNYASGIQWLADYPSNITDYLSRKIIILKNSGHDVSPLLNDLISMRNGDGGWGGSRRYVSNATDTALALKALSASGYGDTAVISSAIAYLKSKQNADGGWGNDEGRNIEITAYVLTAFHEFRSAYALEGSITAGLAWLGGKQNADGGFGNSPSTVYDTAIAVIVLHALGGSKDIINKGNNFILGMQSADGSWYGSAHQTALAINAIWNAVVYADISVKGEDITFIPGSIKSLPADIAVSVKLYNLGRTDAPEVKVALYNGSISETTKVGEQTVAIPGQSDVIVTFAVTINDGNQQKFYVSADPGSQIVEPNKTNNIAVNVINPDTTYDFEVSDVAFSQNPVDITNNVTISSKVTNHGTMNAYNVQLKYFVNDPAGQIDIATVTVNIPANSTIANEVIWKTSKAGINLPIVVAADPFNLFTEISEDNNVASQLLTVNGSTDPNLTLSYKDLTYTPAVLNERGNVNISATVRNEGFAPAANVKVNFYLGVPDVDGILIGSQTIPAIDAGAAGNVSIDWINIPVSGERILYVQVDPDNLLQEITKEDNDAFTTIFIHSIPDLAISTNSITFNPSAPKDGDTVAIDVVVKNLGRQTANNVTVQLLESGTLIGNQTIAAIGGYSQGSATYSYSTAGKKGTHEITAVVDPDNLIVEQSKDNNTATRSFGVQDANLWVTEPYISPNGDDIKDSTDFFFRMSLTQTVKVNVINERGEVVRTFSDETLNNTSGGNITWNGFNDQGMVVADGQYQITIIDAGNNNIGSLVVAVDNNQSPLTKAIGTKYLLNNNLTCMLPDLSLQWFPDESGILIKIPYSNANAPEYPAGLYTVSPDGQDILRIIPWEAPWDYSTSKIGNYNVRHAIRGAEISPDGNKIFIILERSKASVYWNIWNRDGSQLWVVDRDGRNLKLLDSYDSSSPQQYIYDAKWSPNSDYLAYSVSNGSGLFLIKSDGTGKTNLDSVVFQDFSRLKWSPDGTKLAYTVNDSNIIRITNILGDKQDLTVGNDSSYVSLEWFNNQKLVFQAYNSNSYYPLWLVDATGAGSHLRLSDNTVSFAFSPDKTKFAYNEFDADKSYLKIADGAGNVTTLYDSKKSMPNNYYVRESINSISWSPDGAKIAFYDNQYEKIDDCHTKQYLVVLNLKDNSKKAFPSSTCVDSCYQPIPSSYHIYTKDGDVWQDRGALHYRSIYETKMLDLAAQYQAKKGSFAVRIIQKGMDAAHIDYVALSVNGVHYRPVKAVNVDTDEDILSNVLSLDRKVADAYGATIDLMWENVPAGHEVFIILNANEEIHANKQSSNLIDKTNQYDLTANKVNSSYMACATVGDDESRCANDASYGLQWLSDSVSLLTNGSTVVSSIDGTKVGLPISHPSVSPFGRYFTYQQYVNSTSVCYGRGSWDIWAISSLLNLTVDLQVKKEKSAVILRGIAVDLNFEGYKLEYADVQNPTVWNLVKPPSNVPVLSDIFTTWVPPYEGVFYVKLTAWDKAGNVKWDRKRITWGLTASITNLYKTQDIISPNGDGIKDSVELHYTVLEPVHLEFNIIDNKNNIVRTYLKDHVSPVDDYITWDGRDSDGKVAADGKYVLKVFDYEFFVEIDNKPPLTSVSLSAIKQETLIDNNGQKTIGPLTVYLTASVSDKNIIEGLLSYGEGDNPQEWYSYATIAQDEHLQRFENTTIAQLVGKKFKASADDYAGNKNASVSGFLEERVILLWWEEDPLLKLNQHQMDTSYDTIRGIVPDYHVIEVKTTCKDDFQVRDDLKNVPECNFSDPDPENQYGEFLSRIEYLPASAIRPGTHTIHVLETVRTTILSMSIQYWNGSKWVDSQTTTNPKAGYIELSWDISGIDSDELILIRVKAVDETGKEFYSNIVRVVPVFYMSTRCEGLGSLVYGHNNLYEKLDLLKIQVKSDKDTNNSVWTDLATYRRANGGIIPEGKFPIEDLPAIKSGMGYRLRMVGTIGEGINAREYISEEISYPPVCLWMELLVEYPDAAECDAVSSGKVKLSTDIKYSRFQDAISLISLDYYIQKPEGWQLLRHYDLSKEQLDAILVDTSAMPVGVYPVNAVLKYIHSEEREVFKTNHLIVDRTLPTSRVTYPIKSQKLCRVKQTDTKGDWYGIPVEGIAIDNTDIRKCDIKGENCGIQLYFGAGEDAEAAIKALTIEKGKVIPIAKENQIKGQIGIWDVTHLTGTDYTLKLKVTDTVGNTCCDSVSFFVDSQVDIRIFNDKRFFSPNNDDVLDDVNISYEISEYAKVDVKVFKILEQADHSYRLDQTPVRTIVTGVTHLNGTDYATWDGKNDAGTVVPDGIYGIVVMAKDSCENVNTKWVAVEVDNTPPAVAITYPRPVDVLSNIVEIRGTVDDLHFQSYVLEAGEGTSPDSWIYIASSANPVKEEATLGKWNTFGLEGVWTIRLTGKDIVGNEKAVTVTINLTQRKTLIKDLGVAPLLFSPNFDGKVDTAMLSYELTDACHVKIEILDSTAAVKKTYTTTTQSLGVYTYTWDGKDGLDVVVADGVYKLKLTAALSSNPLVTQTEAITVRVDVTLPLIDIQQPASDSYLKTNTLSVYGTVSDKNIKEYAAVYTGDGGSVSIDAGTQNRENYIFGTLPELADGKYTLNVNAKDNAENIKSSNIVFTIDTTRPKATLASVRDGEYYGAEKNAINITGGIIEKNLDYYKVQYGLGDTPSQWNVLLTGNTVPVIPQFYTWKVGAGDGVADGLYTLSLYAKDKAGWTGEAKVKIIIDNTLPDVAITSLKNDDYVKAAVDIKGTAFDANLDHYTLDMSEGQCAGAFKWATIKKTSTPVNNDSLGIWQNLPADGDYCIRLTAMDKVGLKAEAMTQVKVDTTPPAPPTLSGKIDNKADASLAWTKNTEDDFAGYNLYRNGEKVNASLLTDLIHVELGLNENTYKYIVTSLDLAGNESKPSNEVVLKVDLTPPTVRINSPLDGAKVSSLVDIKGSAFSSDDFKQYRVYIGQGAAPPSWTLIRTSPAPITFGSLTQWDTIGTPDGLYSIKLEGEDLSGNVGTFQISVTTDNEPPAATVLLTAVPNGSDVTLTWQASSETELAGYLLYRNDQLANVAGIVVGNLKPYLIAGTTYLDNALPDGKFRYNVVVMDQAGNVSEQSNTLEVDLDTHAPHITITEPLNQAKFQNKTLIRGESPDLDIASVQFQYKKSDDATWLNLNSPVLKTPFVTYIDPAVLGLTFGDYNVRAVATDNGNNVDPAPTAVSLTYTDLVAPDAPVDLAASFKGGDVSLSWKANSEIDLEGYNIYRILDGGKTKINAALVTGTAYQDNGLADGDYSYEITALDTYDNESEPSNSAVAKIYTPKLSQPYTPTGQQIIAVTGSEAGSENSVEMFIDLGSGPVSQGTVSANSQGNFSASALNLVLGENKLTAVARDSDGNVSKISEIVHVIYNEAPKIPTGLNAAVQDYSVTLTWNPNAEADMAGYNLYRNGEKVNGALPVSAGTVTASSSYSYNPPSYAFDANSSTFWRSLSYDIPAWLEIALPSSELINHIEIQWFTNSGDMTFGGRDYEIQAWSGHAWIPLTKVTGNTDKANAHDFSPSYRTDRIRIHITEAVNYFVGLSEVKINKDNLIVPTSYSDVELNDGRHQYKLTAVDYYGFESNATEEREAAVGDVSSPDAPLNLTAGASETTITLNWVANNEQDLAGYNVYRMSGQDWVRLNTVALISANTYADATLANGSYIYRVTAVDEVGNESLPSNEAQATVSITPPPPPITLSISVVAQGSSLNAVWSYGGQTPVGYHLYRSMTSGGPYVKINAALIGVNSYLDAGLTNGTVYYYVVTALDANGNESVYSNESAGTPRDTEAPEKSIIYYPILPGMAITLYNDLADIIGTAEPGSSVELFKNGVPAGKATASGATTTTHIALGNANAYGVTLSPDGRWLIYVENDNGWLKNLVDGSASMLSEVFDSVSWAPDSTRFSYRDYYGRIYIYNIKTDIVSPLSSEENAHEQNESWSFDGSKIAYISGNNGWNVWVKNLSSGEKKQITTSGTVYNAKISPDGSRIAYFDNYELYVINIANLEVIRIESDVSEVWINWSPDSKKIAYVATNNNLDRIFIADATQSTIIKTVSSSNNAFYPIWSPDGRSIIFLNEGNAGGYTMMEALLDSDQTSVLVPHCSDCYGFDWIRTGYVVYFDQNQLNIVSRQGKFHFSDVPLSEGQNEFQVVATDTYGNIGVPSDAIHVVYDVSTTPDLEITEDDISVYPPYPKPGEKVSIFVSVNNRGEIDVEDVNVLIFILTGGKWELLKDETLPIITADASQTVRLEWSPLSATGINTLYVVADPENKIRERSEDNNVAYKDIVVIDQNGASMTTKLNAAQYGADQDVHISVNVKNAGEGVSTMLSASVKDANGGVAASFDPVNLQLEYASSRAIGFVWNTASSFSGQYNVHTVLKSGQGVVMENVVPFNIIPDVKIDPVSLTTDKAAYLSGENTELIVNITNSGRNTIISELIARIKISDFAETVVFTDEKMLANLLTGVTGSVKSMWSTANATPGLYSATLEVFLDNQLVSTKVVQFVIDSVSTITGSIAATPISVIYGNEVKVDYSIKNTGNVDVTGAPIRLLVINPESQDVVSSSDAMVDLPMNTDKTGHFIISTQGYKLKTYIVVLQSLNQGATRKIADASFIVKDGLAPVVNIVAPVAGTVFNSRVDIVATAADDLSGVERVEYRIDDGEWLYLPVADPSTGRYSIAWNPAPADEGGHDISFRAFDMAGNMSQPISTSITVNCVAVTKTINMEVLNLLLWINQSECTQSMTDLIAANLQETGANYHIVCTQHDFIASMRNPFFTDFIILGNYEGLADHHDVELREQVYAGKGLIASLYFRNKESVAGDYEPLYGLTYNSVLPGVSHVMNIPAGNLLGAASLELSGQALRAEASKPENVHAWMQWQSSYNSTSVPSEYPAFVTNDYGLGKTVFMAFDYMAQLNTNYETLTQLLKSAITFVHNATEPDIYPPQKYVPISISLKNTCSADDLWLSEQYPAQIKIYDPVLAQWIADNPWNINVHLGKDESKIINYFVFTPDLAGTYTIQTKVEKIGKSVSASIAVRATDANLAATIITALDALKSAPENADTTLFGAKKFLRTPGSANAYTSTFQATAGEAKLNILNGDGTGSYLIKEAVVYLNGNVIYAKSDFASGPMKLEKTVSLLEGTNTLRVELYGVSRNYLTLEIVRESMSKVLINDAVLLIQNVQSRSVSSKDDVESNILDIVAAIEKIVSIQTVDISAIRLKMVELLQMWEANIQLY